MRKNQTRKGETKDAEWVNPRFLGISYHRPRVYFFPVYTSLPTTHLSQCTICNSETVRPLSSRSMLRFSKSANGSFGGIFTPFPFSPGLSTTPTGIRWTSPLGKLEADDSPALGGPANSSMLCSEWLVVGLPASWPLTPLSSAYKNTICPEHHSPRFN